VGGGLKTAPFGAESDPVVLRASGLLIRKSAAFSSGADGRYAGSTRVRRAASKEDATTLARST
jgi:hypothetical protein